MDIGENILLFEFNDCLDLERVLEFEPWSYDKSLVAFQRVQDFEIALRADYSHATFWVQFHNVPVKSLSHETRELIEKAVGVVVQVANLEDDGSGGGEFLRVQVTTDISKPLPRCTKLRSEGKQLGLVGIKYERLPNFYYCCGHVTHGGRECEVVESRTNTGKSENCGSDIRELSYPSPVVEKENKWRANK